jgi:putative transposase
LGLSVEIVRKPQKPVAEKVAKRWAEEWAKEGKQVDWQRLMLPKGFRVLPRRWVVERTFAWISHNRRMAKDYERLCATGEAFIYVAMSRLMVRRLARCIGVSRQSLEGEFCEVRLDGVLGSPYSAL